MTETCESLLRKCNLKCDEDAGGIPFDQCVQNCFAKYRHCLADRHEDWRLLMSVLIHREGLFKNGKLDPRKIARASSKAFAAVMSELMVAAAYTQPGKPQSKAKKAARKR